MESGNISQARRANQPSGNYIPEVEHRRSFVSLRWLVVILASYLTLFTHLSNPRFPIFFAFTFLFAATNIALAFVSPELFQTRIAQRAIVVCDIIFICGTIYLLRVSSNYLHVGFMLLFVLAALWRDLRPVLISLLVVSMLFGLFAYFRIAHFDLSISIEQFLTLSLFFIVSMFYVFLSEQLRRDAALSRAVLEEKRNAEVMVDVTRGLSSSLKTQDVLRMVVARVCEVSAAVDCSIITVDPRTGDAKVMVRSSEPDLRYSTVDWNSAPEVQQAALTRRMVFTNGAQGVVVTIPMISQDALLGVIHVSAPGGTKPPSDAMIRFFEVMASTAANALRNAQLFEEVEQRARTDF